RGTIYRLVELLRVVPFLAEQVKNEPWIEIAAAGAHHEATRRGESHCRIHGLSVTHGSQAGAVAEMRDYHAAPRSNAQNAHNVFVRQAMKAVASYSDIPELACHWKTCRDLGHRAMKRGVEARDLRKLRKPRANRLDRRNCSGQMQRYERND